MKHYRLSRDFTDAPGGRFRRMGDFSGEEFRDDFLLPMLQEGDVFVDLDGALGLPPSFLDESFGAVARLHANLLPRLKVKITDNKVAEEQLLKLLPSQVFQWQTIPA